MAQLGRPYRPEVIETWIPVTLCDAAETRTNALMTVDLGQAWRETFAKWDRVVDSDVAEEIATATERILRLAATAS